MLGRAAPKRPTVLTLLGAYWPGNAASGPNQSFRALCEALADEFEFKLVARDRPFGAADAVSPVGWTDLGFAQVRYCAVGRLGAVGLKEILRQEPYDLLLMNGFFDREFTLPALLLRRLGLAPRRPAIVSPRGEFATGALSLKSGVKAGYLQAARRLHLLEDVHLHATGPREAQDIARAFPWSRGVLEAPNVRARLEPAIQAPSIQADKIRLIFLGRISPVKNLSFAIEALRAVRAPVSLDIYGPISDRAYWERCQGVAASLPRHVETRYMGEIPQDEVPQVLAAHDLLLLPTLGENFGHAIFEALACGVPVLISDQTPWQDLEEKTAGWSLPLGNPLLFATAIDALAAMTPAERANLRTAATAVAASWLIAGDAVAKSRNMLATALEGARPSTSPASEQRSNPA